MRRGIFFLSILFIFFLVYPAYPYWIWTPKTKKWVNPKYAVKPTPKEQMKFSLEVYELNELKRAEEEFKKLIRYYPKSFEASEAQYYLGAIEERRDNLYEAYLAYQKVIDKYPFSERVQKVIEREYKIAEAFMAGKTRKALGVNLPVENPAIEIFQKVVENSTYGPLAAQAQYKLGLVLRSLGRYLEAEDEFQKVISNYPNSEWVAAAKFQIASCEAAVSKGPDYDHEATAQAKEKFEEFVKEHPDAALSEDAVKNIVQLKMREAESNFNIASFYEKQKAVEAAKIYYNYVIDNYPESPWAKKAQEKLKAMEKKK